MKAKNLFLVALLMVTFGTSDLFAQVTQTTTTVQTSKPKRKYTKKIKADATYPTQGMPSTNAAVKPKRKYTRKTTVTSNTTMSPAAKTVSTKTVAKSTYQTKKTAPQKATYQPTSGGTVNGHQILVGPRGGKYYINKNGHKTYVK
jgi:colicin import membrane protein